MGQRIKFVKRSHNMDHFEDQKQQYLGFIQDIISRLNNNSFQLKNFALLLITGCLGIYASNKESLLFPIAIILTFFFWWLDSFYLCKERRFRGLFEDAVKLDSSSKKMIYKISLDEYKSSKDKKFGRCNAFFSPTLFWFYFPLISVLIFLFLILKIDCILIILK